MYSIISILSFVICFILIMHHAYEHRDGGKHPLYGIDKYFQISDIGNFKTFNHETFVILFFTIGTLSAYLYYLKKKDKSPKKI